MVKTLLIFGCGYTCQFLAKSLIAEGWKVIGTTMSKENAEKLFKVGIQPVFWEDEEKIKETIFRGCSVLNSIAPSFTGDIVLAKYQKLLSNENTKLNWLGFLSTTAGNKPP